VTTRLVNDPVLGTRPRGRAPRAAALACVLGGLDIVGPLGRAGVRCAVAAGPRDPVRHSRHVHASIDRLDCWAEPEALVARLVAWARVQAARPVLFYPTDGDLLMVSRFREPLGEVFDFLVPDAGLIESLVDKERFQDLAGRLGLPVPPSAVLPAGHGPADLPAAISFPLVVKPVLHSAGGPFAPGGKVKAVRVDTPDALAEVLRLVAAGGGFSCVVQALVPGPESRIESYHAFVDEFGTTVAEFTGEKVRTYPPEYGHSTAVTVGRRPDVLAAGREVLAAIGLRSGVAKVDFKRGPDGRLWLFEVNPRFNLWHNAGAAAGVNLPAEFFARVTGRPRPREIPFRAGTSWCDVRNDRRAARAAGVPLASWLRFAVTSRRSSGDWNDPMPLLRSYVLPALARRFGRPPRA
jgi:D-aspartate ligase